MQIDKLKIEYLGKSEEIFVRPIKFRLRAKLLDAYRDGVPLKEDGTLDQTKVPNSKTAELTVGFIVNSVCDAEGTLTLTADEVDDWPSQKIAAYDRRITEYQMTPLEAVAKNSSTTANGAT